MLVEHLPRPEQWRTHSAEKNEALCFCKIARPSKVELSSAKARTALKSKGERGRFGEILLQSLWQNIEEYPNMSDWNKIPPHLPKVASPPQDQELASSHGSNLLVERKSVVLGLDVLVDTTRCSWRSCFIRFSNSATSRRLA
jgi:hypothetical protein